MEGKYFFGEKEVGLYEKNGENIFWETQVQKNDRDNIFLGKGGIDRYTKFFSNFNSPEFPHSP